MYDVILTYPKKQRVQKFNSLKIARGHASIQFADDRCKRATIISRKSNKVIRDLRKVEQT